MFQDISNRKEVLKKQFKHEALPPAAERPCPNINFINKLQDKKQSIIEQVIHSNMMEAPN